MLPGPEHGQVRHLFVPDHTIVIDVQIVLDIYVLVRNNGHFGSFGTPLEGIVCLMVHAIDTSAYCVDCKLLHKIGAFFLEDLF